MTDKTKRLLIQIEDGLISSIRCDGIDLSDVLCVVIDRDTEGADREDLTPFGTDHVWFSIWDIEPADDDTSRDLRRAYDTWAEI